MPRRIRILFTLLAAAATTAAVVFAVRLSLDPANYFFYGGQDRTGWKHDPASVAFLCCLIVAEAALFLAAVLAPRPKRLWARCLFGLVVLGPWAMVSTMAVLHVPLHVLFHHLWVWLLVMALVLIGATSGARHLLQQLRAGACT